MPIYDPTRISLQIARLAALTVVLIMVTSNMHPQLDPIINAALRFSESCIGATIAVLIVLLFPGSIEETKEKIK